jgi:eukaryotic-like serine/threonine-protein kinase
VTLAAGSKLGPYEVLGQLGAGGMGEVYRARDPRLGREVAIKVLPPSFSSDADRLRRFEQEARAAGVLNHPNITAVYDIGQHEEAPYVVQELLEGETLRAVLAGGKISPRKAVEYALQIARGLAAAHEKGIVHRDLKPENLFITRDGRVKILDFGLAKLTQPEGAGSAVTSLPTETRGTEPGIVLGTLGYMSPEQVRGRTADARSDIFSFGAILYEMLSGNRAFRGDSAADTMSAILREDPPDLSVTNQAISPGLERIVRHCLEKNPEQRFQSASDIAFDLEALSGTSGQAAVGGLTARRGARRPWIGVAIAAGIALGAFALGYLLKPKEPPAPTFQRITYRRGSVGDARFAPDGQTVLYSAAWDGKPPDIFVFTPGSPESRALEISGVRLEPFAVSPAGELAVALPRLEGGTVVGSTLARVPLGGGAPRPVLEDAMAVDWSRDGKSLAVARDVNGRIRLEFPVGKVLYDTSGSISYPRVSPQGDRIAFIDRPIYERPQGRVMLVGLAGGAKVLSEGWRDVQGLAWRPDGKEIWFAATTRSEGRALHAVTPDGRTRLVARMPGSPWLYDISRDGRVLIDQWSVRHQIAALPPGESRERDLSWLDGSVLADISPDGKRILFSEMGQGGGENSGVYIRGTDGSPAVRLGEGTAFGFSRDVKWALTTLPRAASQLVLLPIGSGEPRELPRGKINYENAWMLPDGKEVVFIGIEPGHGVRTYVQRLDGSPPRAITPDGIWATGLSPDGSVVAARGPADPIAKFYPTAGGEPRAIPGIAAGEQVYGWSADGRRIFVMAGSRPTPLPRTVFRIDLASGKREQWRELAPADLTGIGSFRTFFVAQDEGSYAYSYTRGQSEMYIVEGLK